MSTSFNSPAALRPEFVPSNQDATGNIQWDMSDERPEFIIPGNDSRYLACTKVAQELNARYSAEYAALDPKDPKQYERLVAIERLIANRLNKEIHKEFGDYNKAVAEGADVVTHPSLHGDVTRINPSPPERYDPARLDEFSAGDLICRHYAPLMNSLCFQAGVQTVRLHNVLGGNFVQKDQSLTLEEGPNRNSAHTTVMSLRTGNIIEATNNRDAFFSNITHTTFEQVKNGAPIFLHAGEKRLYVLYPATIENLPDAAMRGALYKERIHSQLPAANALYQDQVAPNDQAFLNAVEAGDVEASRACNRKMPVSSQALVQGLKKAFASKQLPMSEFLIDQGAIENFDTPSSAFSWTFSDKPDEAFQRAIAQKIGVKSREYLALAKGSHSEADANLAKKWVREGGLFQDGIPFGGVIGAALAAICAFFMAEGGGFMAIASTILCGGFGLWAGAATSQYIQLSSVDERNNNRALVAADKATEPDVKPIEQAKEQALAAVSAMPHALRPIAVGADNIGHGVSMAASGDRKVVMP